MNIKWFLHIYLLQLEQEKQDVYFDMLEKTEQMEEKMMGTMEVKCTAVSCLQVITSSPASPVYFFNMVFWFCSWFFDVMSGAVQYGGELKGN